MQVSIVKTVVHYPPPPFHPSSAYPEYPYSGDAIAPEENPVYEAVRSALYLAGLDRENYGTPYWNPFGQFIKEGSRIVIKPNFVHHYNELCDERSYFDALVTHASIIRPLIDYVLLAARGKFTLTIADLPIQSADFSIISKKTGLSQVIEFVRDKTGRRGEIELMDLRDYQMLIDSTGAIRGRIDQPGDPLGFVMVDLGQYSNLLPLEKYTHLFRSADYKGDITVQRHSNGVHQYIISRTILKSDFLINVPKLKVHKKTGVTLSLKNMVGTIGDKSCLPHYREGGPDSGGDEYPVFSAINALRGRCDFALRCLGTIPWRLIRPVGRVLVRLNRMVHQDQPLINATGGNWYGNDTIWRMVHDINCIIFHSDCDGILYDDVRRNYLTVVDGIIGGEGEGPLKPRPVAAGVIVAGVDPLSVDICCTQLMGLDWRKIPLYAKYNAGQRYTFTRFNGDPERIDVVMSENSAIVKRHLDQVNPIKNFEPASGWKGHIER
ncbi:MAG: DUF362 domain-containing protein [Proteobacteria bacterium]|nr:DUF362 domain-containing protein [Pseudomonadota bacterium]